MTVIAVVDDDEDLRTLMTMRLRAAGYEVHQAGDGITGLEVIRACHPDLVVLDWMMPGRNGIEVCRDLRADEAFATTPILIVTARANPSDRSVSLAAGANAVLTKPFTFAAFLDVIRSLVDEKDSLANV